jgi:hypothetical protein
MKPRSLSFFRQLMSFLTKADQSRLIGVNCIAARDSNQAAHDLRVPVQILNPQPSLPRPERFGHSLGTPK